MKLLSWFKGLFKKAPKPEPHPTAGWVTQMHGPLIVRPPNWCDCEHEKRMYIHALR